MKILVIAGGTGGHIYPALSIAQQFKKNGNIISWIGKKESLEEKKYVSKRVFNFSQ